MLQHMGVPYEILPDYAEGTNRLALALETALPSKDIKSNYYYEWNYMTLYEILMEWFMSCGFSLCRDW